MPVFSTHGLLVALPIIWLLSGCGQMTMPPSPDGLPPSASDLNVLGNTKLCDSETSFLANWTGSPLRTHPWGKGKTFEAASSLTTSQPEQFFFFNQDGVLVGTAFRFPHGLSLEPYPVLRRTLSQLQPSLEFFLNSRSLIHGGTLETAVLYRTGDKTTTTRYIVRKEKEGLDLLAAAMAIDPYEPLLARFQQTLMPELANSDPRKAPDSPHTTPLPEQSTFLAMQQFARGEIALFASCGTRDPNTAIEAYTQAIAYHLPDPAQQAEAHHRLGLALRANGRLSEAQSQFEQALTIRPNVPKVINNLGTILAEQGQREAAIAAFEKALVFRPNYARARFNLAEALEPIHPRRALEEYETYLALAEGFPEETERMALARDRINRLQHR